MPLIFALAFTVTHKVIVLVPGANDPKFHVMVWPFFIPVPAFIISKVLGIVSETVTVSEAIWLIPVTVILYWNSVPASISEIMVLFL